MTFKIGDKVRLKNNYVKPPFVMNAKKGATGTVGPKGYFYSLCNRANDEWIDIIWDDTELRNNQGNGGYSPDRFSLVKEDKMIYTVGKQYRLSTGRSKVTYTCLAFDLKGMPIFQSEGSSAFTINDCQAWTEYKEPVRHVRYVHWWRNRENGSVMVTWTDTDMVLKTGRDFEFIKTDTVEYIENE